VGFAKVPNAGPPLTSHDWLPISLTACGGADASVKTWCSAGEVPHLVEPARSVFARWRESLWRIEGPREGVRNALALGKRRSSDVHNLHCSRFSSANL
jgi:hypothetical protein